MLTLREIKNLTEERFFKRGECYLNNVDIKRRSHTKLSAVVSGRKDYTANISRSRTGNISYSCSCPVGQSGKFCKHLVALALLNAEKNDISRWKKLSTQMPERELRKRINAFAKAFPHLRERELVISEIRQKRSSKARERIFTMIDSFVKSMNDINYFIRARGELTPAYNLCLQHAKFLLAELSRIMNYLWNHNRSLRETICNYAEEGAKNLESANNDDVEALNFEFHRNICCDLIIY